MIAGLSSISDDDLIGFVSASLVSGAISITEMQEWVYYMIETYDDLPPYMYVLMDAKEYGQFREMIGFSVGVDFKYDESRALSGIAWERGNLDPNLEHAFSRKAGLNALKRNPHIGQRFQETFPFLNFEMPT